jgi:DNA repair protein RadC
MKASEIIGIELLDHVIIGFGRFWSFKEEII